MGAEWERDYVPSNVNPSVARREWAHHYPMFTCCVIRSWTVVNGSSTCVRVHLHVYVRHTLFVLVFVYWLIIDPTSIKFLPLSPGSSPVIVVAVRGGGDGRPGRCRDPIINYYLV